MFSSQTDLLWNICLYMDHHLSFEIIPSIVRVEIYFEDVCARYEEITTRSLDET